MSVFSKIVVVSAVCGTAIAVGFIAVVMAVTNGDPWTAICGGAVTGAALAEFNRLLIEIPTHE